jgi:hypothetical protein
MRILEQERRKPSTSIVDSVPSLSQISNVHLSFNPSPSQDSNAHLRVNPFHSWISNAHPSFNPSLSQISNTHPSFNLTCGNLDTIKPNVPPCVPPTPNSCFFGEQQHQQNSVFVSICLSFQKPSSNHLHLLLLLVLPL